MRPQQQTGSLPGLGQPHRRVDRAVPGRYVPEGLLPRQRRTEPEVSNFLSPGVADRIGSLADSTAPVPSTSETYGEGGVFVGQLFRPPSAHGPEPTVLCALGDPLMTQALAVAGLTVFRPDTAASLEAAVAFLVEEGISDAAVIGLYASEPAMSALAERPGLFRAAATPTADIELAPYATPLLQGLPGTVGDGVRWAVQVANWFCRHLVAADDGAAQLRRLCR